MKTIIIAFDHYSCSRAEMHKASGYLLTKGITALLVRVHNYPEKFRVFDLDSLTPLELAEVKQLLGIQHEPHILCTFCGEDPTQSHICTSPSGVHITK
jgi:hypothetical protein